MNLSLHGKYALVCGSSQGIGLAIAKELAAAGATCILLARNEEALKQAVVSLDVSMGQRHHYRSVDFTDVEKTRTFINDIASQNPVHVLINNSGGPSPGPIVDAGEDQFLQAFQQHLIVNHLLTKGVLAGMKAEAYGRIINVVSTSVKIPLKNLGVSNTIRGAVASWAKTMANELGPYGITVNNILPGMTKTGRLDKLIAGIASATGRTVEEVETNMMAEIPAGRFGEAAEIASLAAFLAAPAAAYINGASIPVDGGRTGSI